LAKAAEIGKESLTLAWVTAHGHANYVPNTIKGAAEADVAILVVATTTNEFESGFVSRSVKRSSCNMNDNFRDEGQTREHLMLLSG